jgi:hypothetical protein
MKKTGEVNATAQAVAEVVKTGEVVHPVNLSAYKFQVDTKGDGKPLFMTISDLVEEIKALQTLTDKTKATAEDLAAHMFALAGVCKTPEEFDAVCERIVEQNRWGRPPKGTPKEQRHLWDDMPTAFRIYRSDIFSGWKKYNLYPGKKIAAQVAGPNGKPVQGHIEIKTLSTLRRMKLQASTAEEKRRQAEEAAKKAAEGGAGVHVTPDGQQQLVEVEAASASLKLDPDALALFSKLAQLYIDCPPDLKEEIITGLNGVYDDAAATLEIIQLEQHAANIEQDTAAQAAANAL